jgi:hypothetical protein
VTTSLEISAQQIETFELAEKIERFVDVIKPQTSNYGILLGWIGFSSGPKICGHIHETSVPRKY